MVAFVSQCVSLLWSVLCWCVHSTFVSLSLQSWHEHTFWAFEKIIEFEIHYDAFLLRLQLCCCALPQIWSHSFQKVEPFFRKSKKKEIKKLDRLLIVVFLLFFSYLKTLKFTISVIVCSLIYTPSYILCNLILSINLISGNDFQILWLRHVVPCLLFCFFFFLCKELAVLAFWLVYELIYTCMCMFKVLFWVRMYFQPGTSHICGPFPWQPCPRCCNHHGDGFAQWSCYLQGWCGKEEK